MALHFHNLESQKRHRIHINNQVFHINDNANADNNYTQRKCYSSEKNSREITRSLWSHKNYAILLTGEIVIIVLILASLFSQCDSEINSSVCVSRADTEYQQQGFGFNTLMTMSFPPSIKISNKARGLGHVMQQFAQEYKPHN